MTAVAPLCPNDVKRKDCGTCRKTFETRDLLFQHIWDIHGTEVERMWNWCRCFGCDNYTYYKSKYCHLCLVDIGCGKNGGTRAVSFTALVQSMDRYRYDCRSWRMLTKEQSMEVYGRNGAHNWQSLPVFPPSYSSMERQEWFRRNMQYARKRRMQYA